MGNVANEKKKSPNGSSGNSNGFLMSRSDFAKSSAVEGIVLTPEMVADLEEFDRKNLPAAARRAYVAAKYGTPK